MSTHERYVSLETAKLLKQAGFDWKCRGIYVLDSENDPEYVFSTANFTNTSKEIEGYIRFSAPTLDVAQRWLREVKNYYVSVDVDCDSIWVFYTVRYVFHDGDKYNASYIWEDTEMNIVKHRRIFDNFEEAQEAGIKKALELILEKGE